MMDKESILIGHECLDDIKIPDIFEKAGSILISEKGFQFSNKKLTPKEKSVLLMFYLGFIRIEFIKTSKANGIT
jgi:hypothetical protein